MRISFCKEHFNGLASFSIAPFAYANISNDSLFVYKIDGGPVAVLKAVPVGKVIVNRNGIKDAFLPDIVADRFDVFLKGEFGRVNANHDKPHVGITLMPLLNFWFYVPAVVTTEGPELDQHHFPKKELIRQRFRIYPI